MPTRARALPTPVVEALHEAELIVHAGDFATPDVLEALRAYAPVVGVYGNVDVPEIRALLPRRTIATIGPFRLGVIHGDGAVGSTLGRAEVSFANDAVDCVVFGHSHQPVCVRRGDRLFLNPGSPTDKRREPHYSFAWLYPGDSLTAELVYF